MSGAVNTATNDVEAYFGYAATSVSTVISGFALFDVSKDSAWKCLASVGSIMKSVAV